jgi:hypothetical protein
MSMNELVVVQPASAPPQRYALSADIVLVALGLLALALVLAVSAPTSPSDRPDIAKWISHAD